MVDDGLVASTGLFFMGEWLGVVVWASDKVISLVLSSPNWILIVVRSGGRIFLMVSAHSTTTRWPEWIDSRRVSAMRPGSLRR